MRAMPFAAAALVVALVGCAALGSQTPAAPTAATAPVPSAPTPTAALTAAPTAPATPEPTSAPDPRADWQQVATPNGTTMLGIAANQPGFLTQDGVRGVSFVSLRTMASEADAEAWLAGDEAAELLDIIRTLDLTAAPSPALPSVD